MHLKAAMMQKEKSVMKNPKWESIRLMYYIVGILFLEQTKMAQLILIDCTHGF